MCGYRTAKSDRCIPKRHATVNWPRLRLRKKVDQQSNKSDTVHVPFIPLHVKDKHESMLASLLFILVIVQCVCGVVLPISDSFALADTRTLIAMNHRYYLEAFLIGQYSVAILMLAYLQSLIYYYNRQSMKAEKEEALRPIEVEQLNAEDIRDGDASSISSGICEEAVDNTITINSVGHLSSTHRLHSCDSNVVQSTTSGTAPKLTWHPDGLSLYMRLGAVAFGLGVMIHDGLELLSPWELGKASCHSLLWVPKHLLRLTLILWQTYFVFKYHQVVFHVHRFAVQLAFSHVCVVNLCHWFKTVITEVAYSLHNEPSTVNHPTNETSYSTEFDTPSFVETGPLRITVTTTMDHLTEKPFNPVSSVRECKGQLGQILKPFLFPLIIEYSLITGTLFYKLLRRVFEEAKVHNLRSAIEMRATTRSTKLHFPESNGYTQVASPTQLSFLKPTDKELASLDDYNDSRRPTAETQCHEHYYYRSCLGYRVYLMPENNRPDQHVVAEDDRSCHRSHTGLFFGILFFAACIISVASLLSGKSTVLSKVSPYIFRYASWLVLSVCLLVCLIGIIQTYSLRFRQVHHGDSLEYNLLGLGLFGSLIYHMLLFVPSLETVVHWNMYSSIANQTAVLAFTDNTQIDRHAASMYLVNCTLEVLEALLQFFFIIETSQLGPCCRNQAGIKPGRSAIVFLMIANLSLWVINTFEVRKEEAQLSLSSQFYGEVQWAVMTTCLTPLIIFFRFHSTVCLAQIWSTTYTFN